MIRSNNSKRSIYSGSSSKRNSFRKNMRKTGSTKSNNSFLPKTLDQALSEVPHRSENGSKSGSSNPQQPPSVESGDDSDSCYSEGTDAYSLAFSEIHRADDMSELTQPSGGSALFTPYVMGGGLMDHSMRADSMKSMNSSQTRGSSRKLLDTLYQDDDEEDDYTNYDPQPNPSPSNSGSGINSNSAAIPQAGGGDSDVSTVGTKPSPTKTKKNSSLLQEEEEDSSEDEQLLLYTNNNAQTSNHNHRTPPENLYQDDTETQGSFPEDYDEEIEAQNILEEDEEKATDYYGYNDGNEDDMISAYTSGTTNNSMAKAVLEQVDRDVDDESILETESIASIFLYGGMNSTADSLCSKNKKTSRRASLDLRQLKLQKQQQTDGFAKWMQKKEAARRSSMDYRTRRNSLDNTFRPDWGVTNQNKDQNSQEAAQDQQQTYSSQQPRRNSASNTASKVLMEHRRSTFQTPKAADDFVDQIIEQKMRVHQDRLARERQEHLRRRQEQAQQEEYLDDDSYSVASSSSADSLAKHIMEV